VMAKATLYVGIAEPLVEVYRLWLAEVPEVEDPEERKKLLKAFPRREIGAYEIQSEGGSESPAALVFRTVPKVPPQRVEEKIEAWCGSPPKELRREEEPVPPLDYRHFLAEIQRTLGDLQLSILPRVGLTLQQLQRDLLRLQPEMAMIFCHGTAFGELLFEDGRGVATPVPGERLFEAIEPQPQVLFLAACHSESVIRRAKAAWADSAIVSVDSESPIEVTAVAEFQSLFFDQLLAGRSAGEAFDAAAKHVRNSESMGDLAFEIGQAPASEKFRINAEGRDLELEVAGEIDSDPPADFDLGQHLKSPRIRRGVDRFVGRRREMAQVLDALLPLPPGRSRKGAGDRRLVTITKEGGIGKTSLAAEISTWVHERGFFPAAVREVSCEDFTAPTQLLSGLLELFGVSPENQKGDLLRLLGAAMEPVFPSSKRALLVLDNLDDLIGKQVALESRQEMRAILETLLGSAPELWILATCRWPTGLGEHEAEIGLAPLSEDDSLAVFSSHVASRAHLAEARNTWAQPNSPIRQLIRLSGRHPQSLRLLARQLGRQGMTLAKLRGEAHENLLDVLTDPYAADDEEDRQLKVERSYELSYRHLSEAGQELFARMSMLPGGVWLGAKPEFFLKWVDLLGKDWKSTLEKELAYFALVHFEADPSGLGDGVYRMLPAMVEFSRQKIKKLNNSALTSKCVDFWAVRLYIWSEMLSGRAPSSTPAFDAYRELRDSRQFQNYGTRLFTYSQANWLHCFDLARARHSESIVIMLATAARFLEFNGQANLYFQLATKVAEKTRRTNDLTIRASCDRHLGFAQRAVNEHQGALASFEKALKIYRILDQSTGRGTTDLATALDHLGISQIDNNMPALAQESFKEALVLLEEADNQNEPSFKEQIAQTLEHLGNTQSRLQDFEAARTSLEKAHRIKKLLTETNPSAYGLALATSLNNLAILEQTLENYAKAEVLLQEAVNTCVGISNSTTRCMQNEMGAALLEQKKSVIFQRDSSRRAG